MSNKSHLRKRSSLSNIIGRSSFLELDPTTGEINLPPSPPKVPYEKNWGYSEDKKLPPYSRKETPRLSLRLPRPWLSVLGLAAAILTFITIFSLSPGSATSVLSRIHPTRSCEPYSSFGTLTADTSDADANRWTPFDRKCSPPGFLKQLRAESTTTDFSWLYNKTALVIGDSISREHVENFCNLMGEESEVVRSHHKYSPASTPTRGATKSTHALEKPARLTSRGHRVVRDASLPRICYIAKYDFLIASVFHFGLDQEDYWRESEMPQYQSPGMFEHRLSDIIQPLIANFRRDGRRSAPDFIELSSGTWDLARWAEQDIASEKNTETSLTQDRITWYRFRVGQMLERIRNAFPETGVKTWRTLHYPSDQVAEHDYFMDKISSRAREPISAEVPPPSFAHKRIYQLDQAVRSLLLPSTEGNVVSPAPHSDFRINEWGPILKGHEAHQKDRLHGQALPGSYVWGDIMLFELWRGSHSKK